MSFFGIGRKRTKRVKRQPNAEQMSRNAELKRQSFVAKSFIEMAKEDPEWRRQMVAAEYHLKLPSKDPSTEQQKEIEALLSGFVIKELKENPELAKRVVEARIAQLTNQESFMEYGDNEPSSPGSSIGQILEEIEDLEELKTRLGSGKDSTWAEIFKDPQVIASLLSTFNSIWRGSTSTDTEPKVMVQIDGVPTIVAESELQKLQQAGRLKPFAIIESPKIDKEQPVDEAAPEVTSPDKASTSNQERVTEDNRSAKTNELELPFDSNLIDFNNLIRYLEQTPAEAVERLEAEKRQEKPYALTLWTYLESVKYENLMEELSAYKSHSIVGSYTDLLLSDEGRLWLSEAIELIKQRGSRDVSGI